MIPLWRIMRSNEDLFYDFLRTTRHYEPEKVSLGSLSDCSGSGECQISKEQFKGITKLLRTGWFAFS